MSLQHLLSISIFPGKNYGISTFSLWTDYHSRSGKEKKKSKKESGILSENASFITFPFFPFAITVRIEYTLRIKNEMNPVKHSAMNREQAQTKRKLH